MTYKDKRVEKFLTALRSTGHVNLAAGVAFLPLTMYHDLMRYDEAFRQRVNEAKSDAELVAGNEKDRGTQ